MNAVPVLTQIGRFRFIIRILLSDDDARVISCQIRAAKHRKIVAFGVNPQTLAEREGAIFWRASGWLEGEIRGGGAVAPLRFRV